MAERAYYVSWVDKRTDPWPQWERPHTPGQDWNLGQHRLQILPDGHPQWPGVPWFEGSGAAAVSDQKMGLLSWPGIPFKEDGRGGKLYTGPTISALFHPASRFSSLKGLDRVYLLYQPESADGPHALLQRVLEKIARARGVSDFSQRLQLVPIAGITDPTSHEMIIKAIETWLQRSDPFNFGGRKAGKATTRITINLSAGTPSMHAAWLMLRWNGALEKSKSIVDYVQGDGGLRGDNDDADRDPLRVVPIDLLSQWVGQEQTVVATPTTDAGSILLEDLQGPPYDFLRQKVDHAALLGLPVLLQGERGTGKTSLAWYYHQRRCFYRQQRGDVNKAKSKPAPPAKKNASERYPEKTSENPFVTVTLSEFSDLETLRDTLFGWAKNAWNLAFEAYDGLLGESHNGTLFLDEIHHLPPGLQAALLGPLNARRYRPKMATYEIISNFDLVVATNDPSWRSKMADDFRDRIERIIIEVPPFRYFQRFGIDILWRFWEFTLRKRCIECGIEYSEEGPGWLGCKEQLLHLFKGHPLTGNWRDLQRLADHVLLHLTSSRDGRPSPLRWDKEQLEHAIDETFAS